MNRREVGSVEEEARRLAEALSSVREPVDDSGPALRLLRGGAGGGDGSHDDACVDDTEATGCSSCGGGARGAGGAWCPLCSGSAWVSENAPGALRSLADVASLLADGLHTLAESIENRGRGETSTRHEGWSEGTFHPRQGRPDHAGGADADADDAADENRRGYDQDRHEHQERA